MAADDFTIAPSEVVEIVPVFNNVVTDSESMKQEYLNLSTTSIQRYKIKFNAKTTAEKDAVLAHYNGRYAGYDEFIWTSVPAYVNSGANLTGRWVTGSLQFTPIGYKRWNISITFQKSN